MRANEVKYVITLGEFKRIGRDVAYAVLGAGHACKNIISFLRPNRPRLIIDSDEARQREKLLGYDVRHPLALGDAEYSIIIISTLNYHVAIYMLEEYARNGVVFVIPPTELVYGYDKKVL